MRLYIILASLCLSYTPVMAQTTIQAVQPAPVTLTISDLQTNLEKAPNGTGDVQRATFTLSGINKGKKDVSGGYVELIAYQGGQLFSPAVTFTNGKGKKTSIKNPFPTIFKGNFGSAENPVRGGATFTATITEAIPVGNDMVDQVYGALWKGQKTGAITFRVNVAQVNYTDGSVYYGKSIMLGDMKEHAAKMAQYQTQMQQIPQASEAAPSSPQMVPAQPASPLQQPSAEAPKKYPVIDLRRN